VSRLRSAPAGIAGLTPQQELGIRLSGRPAALYAALQALDAELEAAGRHLPVLLARFAVRHAGHPGTVGLAVSQMRTVQRTRSRSA